MDESLHGDERSLRGSSIILGKPAVRRDSAASCLDMTTPARCSHPSSFLDVPSSSFTLGRTFGQVVTNAQPPSLSDSTARKNNSPPPPVRHCIHEVRQSFCQDLPPSLLARPLPPQCASSVVDKGDVSLNRGEARRGSQRALGTVEPVLVHGYAYAVIVGFLFTAVRNSHREKSLLPMFRKLSRCSTRGMRMIRKSRMVVLQKLLPIGLVTFSELLLHETLLCGRPRMHWKYATHGSLSMIAVLSPPSSSLRTMTLRPCCHLVLPLLCNSLLDDGRGGHPS